MTQEEVAKEMGTSRKTVGKVLREAGVNRADRKAKKIQSLNEKGNSVEQIAKKTGCSDRTVYRALKNTADKNAEGAPEAALTEPAHPETAVNTNVDAAVSVSVTCAAHVEETAVIAKSEVMEATPVEEGVALYAGEKIEQAEQTAVEYVESSTHGDEETASDKMLPVEGNESEF